MTTVESAAAPETFDAEPFRVERGPVRRAALWAFVGAGATAGGGVVLTEALSDDVRAGIMTLGLVLIIAAAALALVLAVHEVLPAERPMAVPDHPYTDAAPDELTPEAVMALWVFGGAGVASGAIAIFLSASALGSSVLVLSGLACLVLAAARRLPRGF